MKHSYETLPEGYVKSFSIDLQKDKKLMLIVNGIALLIMIAMIVPMMIAVPLSDAIDAILDMDITGSLLSLLGLAAAMVLYMVLHEAIHGITMKLFGASKIKYGFTGVYAFAGSETYFAKAPYIVIALAPVVVFLVVFAVLQAFMPNAWWQWFVYFLQICNISGAGGDLYVTCRFSRLPKDVLVQDSGVGMTVFVRESTGSAE